MVRTKVFVGNLSFKTREAELAQEFSAVAKVVGANIITRGPRSLGYGFVELESEEDAHKAVAAMDKKEIDGRPINVEVAKLREEGEANPAAPASGDAAVATSSPSTRGKSTRGAGRGARGGARGRGTRGGARGGRGGKAKVEGDATASPATTPAAAPAPKAPKEKKERVPREPREPLESKKESQTALFVANLPFSLTDETFGNLFTENGLKFKTAHVVTKRNSKSKGFGFVDFNTNEEQQKALTTMAGKKVEDRELVLRVALEESVAPTAAATDSPKPATPATETKTN